MKKKKIVIIGAGIGGLSTAYWLLERGYDVEILEATDRPAGRMVTLERNGDRVDVGAQFYHSNFTHGLKLINEIGLGKTKRSIRGKIQYRLMDGSSYSYGNRLVYMNLLGLRGNLKLYWFSLWHVLLRNRIIPHRITEDIPSSDDVGVLDFFKSDADKPLRDFLITPISMGASHGLPEWMSLYHFIRMMRMFLTTNYVGLAGGVASLAEALAKEVPVQYESPVKQVVMERGRAVGVQMEDGSVRRADHVVVALDAASAARVMPDELEEQRRFFAGVIYSPSPMPVFFLDRPLRRDTWNYWNDPRLERTFKFAIDGWAKMPEMCPSGKSVLTAWTGHPMSMDLMNRPDDVLIREAQEDLELMVPGFSDWIEEVTVVRLPFATERFPVGTYRRVADFMKGAQSLQGISFVNALFGGCGMESSMVSATDAVDRICKEVVV